MAHWFHRNPLKATAPQDFNLKMVSHDVEAIKVSDAFLRASRLFRTSSGEVGLLAKAAYSGAKVVDGCRSGARRLSERKLIFHCFHDSPLMFHLTTLGASRNAPPVCHT